MRVQGGRPDGRAGGGGGGTSTWRTREAFQELRPRSFSGSRGSSTASSCGRSYCSSPRDRLSKKQPRPLRRRPPLSDGGRQRRIRAGRAWRLEPLGCRLQARSIRRPDPSASGSAGNSPKTPHFCIERASEMLAAQRF